MRIFPPAIEIGDLEGFSSEKDIFKRAEFGAGLANILKVSEDPLVVVLDGPWGSGKTTFIRMLAGLLRRGNHPTIYFDAFANDYAEDAFIAIAGEVVKISKEYKKTNTKAYKRFLDKAANTGRAVIGGGLKIGLKAATLGVIDAADIEELSAVAKDIADEVGTKTDAYIKALLIRHADAQKSVESVRAALSELVMSLPESPDSPSKENPPQLIFIIDELDRCKPTFALEIIEKIKHIFSVPGIHFLIVTHLKQLENSVRYSYGADIDSQTYLQKFYNLIVHLPGDGTHEHESIAARYFAYLKPRLNHDEGALNFIATVGQARNLTLRPIEKMAVYASLGIAFTTSSKMEWFRAPPILGGLCALKVLDPDLFQKAKSGTLTFEEAANAFRFERWPQTSKNDWAKSWWQYALDPSIDVTSEEWRGWGRGEFRFDKRSDMVRFVAESVIDRMEIPKE